MNSLLKTFVLLTSFACFSHADDFDLKSWRTEIETHFENLFKRIEAGIKESEEKNVHYAHEMYKFTLDAVNNIFQYYKNVVDHPMMTDPRSVEERKGFATYIEKQLKGFEERMEAAKKYIDENWVDPEIERRKEEEAREKRKSVIAERKQRREKYQNRPRLNCKCGLSTIKDRIVNGTSSKEGAYPWYTGVSDAGGWQFCGATVINSRWILTAAHCVNSDNVTSTPAATRVRPGSHVRNDINPQEVTDVIVHEKYIGKENSFLNDIALIRLKEPLDLENGPVKPSCLPGDGEEDFDNLVAIGMGAQSGKEYIGTLQEANFRVIPHFKCEQLYGKFRYTEGHICGNNVGGVGVCYGDSGGPLLSYVNGLAHNVGIASWVVACGADSYPGVFTRVSEYLDWIHDHVYDGEYCQGGTIP